MNESPKISVIIPVYNVEAYLPQCLDSLLGQTMTNWEALCVDDGSPDNSGGILDEYAARDSRIRVIHQENGGVSIARNRGLDAAQGKYVVMVDPDDWVEPDFLETLHDTIERDGSDMAVCGHFEHAMNGGIAERSPLRHGKKEDGHQPISVTLLRFINPYSWDKMYRLEILNRCRVRYEKDVPFGEDLIFIQRYLLQSHSVSIVRRSLYHYRRVESSATERFAKGEMPVCYYKCTVNLLSRIPNYFPPSMGNREKRMWYTALFAQNFHQIYLIEHCIRRSKRSDIKQIRRAERKAFWSLFVHTPKGAALRIMFSDFLLFLKRLKG